MALSSQEAMERLRLAIDAFNRRDVDAMLRWNHPDVVYQTAIASMEGEEGVYHGHEGVRQWSRDLDEAMEDLHGELHELYDLGDGRYLGAGRFQGRGKESGAEFDVSMAWVYVNDGDGLLVRYEAYFERDQALASLGLVVLTGLVVNTTERRPVANPRVGSALVVVAQPVWHRPSSVL